MEEAKEKDRNNSPARWVSDLPAPSDIVREVTQEQFAELNKAGWFTSQALYIHGGKVVLLAHLGEPLSSGRIVFVRDAEEDVLPILG